MAEQGAATRRFGCPSCGGGLQYDIVSGKMKCDRCDTLTPVSALQEEQAGDTMEVTEYHCPQCGAAIYSTDTEVTSFCSFCGSDVVLTGKMGRAKRPARIVPFAVTREKCEEAYRNHLKKYRLAPGDLKKAETLSHFRPVYVPFWSYTVEAEGPAMLEGKRSYTQGHYRYDETFDLSMDAEIRQKGILYDASSAFEDETAAMLQHTSRGSVPFHSAYLSGFYAQGADVPGETYHQEAAATAVRMFMNQVKEEQKMDSVTMKGDISENFGLPHARYHEELVMMPVWLLAHRQGARVVYTAVNGDSGTVVCDVPVSNGKEIAVTAVLAVIFFFLLQMFLTMRPEILMALCALLSLIIQFQFSGAQKRLYTRKTRAFEPHKEEEGMSSFVGPAQAMLKVKKDGIEEKGTVISGLGEKLAGFGRVLTWIALVFGFGLLPGVISRAGTSANRRTIILGILIVSLAVMVIHTLTRIRKPEAGPLWPRLLSVLACGAAVVSMLAGQAEDLLYYICAAVMLLASTVELVIINRAHNEYASRPVPFFDREEDAE